MVKMSEIKINVPKGIPLSPLKRKIDRLVKEEEIKWTLFEKCKDELLLDKNDLIKAHLYIFQKESILFPLL